MVAVTSARRSVSVAPGPSGLVEALWVARGPHGAPPRVALPDGRPAAVVRLGGPVRWIDPLTRDAEVIGSVLRGPRTAPQVVLAADPAAPSYEVGARLAPWALSALAPDGGLLVDDHRGLAAVLGLEPAELAGRLGDRADEQAAARALEDLLVAAVRRPVPAGERADLDRVVRLADEERGLVRSIDLARAVDRSLASLHALFAERVGLTPAAFLAGVRMSCAVRELGVDDRGDARRVVEVLRSYADAGYPQREVERFTGLSPLDLRRSVRGMEEVLATV
ncbi:helix-turn-helix domain-containing protein [Cellulomonas sp. P4]|uniref:helix-turn-helix domain-containing protein n=1 Tax=Cellulomonas sp. P4 TaxID=3142533 RepID=UPI0031BB898F